MSRLLRLETFAFLSLVLVGSLLPIIMFESVRDVSQPRSVLFDADYSSLFKSFTGGGSDDDNEIDDIYNDDDEDSPEIFTILKNRKDLQNSGFFHLATDWRPSFLSNRCQALMNPSTDIKSWTQQDHGQGGRPSCAAEVPMGSGKLQNFFNSAQATVHVSAAYRIIYVPTVSMFRMQAFYGFEKAIKKRFKTKQMPERMLPLFLKHAKANISDFFVFTFVQHPMTSFINSYNLLQINRTSDDFPSLDSALTQLNKVKTSLELNPMKRAGEDAYLLFNQVYRTQRCLPVNKLKKKVLNFDFIGHLENLQDDWRYVEEVLGVNHVPLQWKGGLHTVRNEHAFERGSADVLPDNLFSSNRTGKEGAEETAFQKLKAQVCDYYEADFECLNYDDSICD